MDLKAKIDEVIGKIKSDPEFMGKFQSNPIQAVESVIGMDLPDDQLQGIIEGVKAKVSIDNAGGILGSIQKLF